MVTYTKTPITKREKEIEGHLKTKTTRFAKKDYITTGGIPNYPAVTREVIEVEPKKESIKKVKKKEKKIEYIKRKKVNYEQ